MITRKQLRVGGNKVGTRRSPWAMNKLSSIFCICTRPKKHHQGSVRTWRLILEGCPVEPLEIEPGRGFLWNSWRLNLYQFRGGPCSCSTQYCIKWRDEDGPGHQQWAERLGKRRSKGTCIQHFRHHPLVLDWLCAWLVLA